MTVLENERRIVALERDSQRRDICQGRMERAEARILMLERHVDGLRIRITGILVALVLTLIGVAANLMILIARNGG